MHRACLMCKFMFHARMHGWVFMGFVWVQTSVVGSPSRTEELFRGLRLWCLSNNTAWSVSAGQPGCLLANISVQFPLFPICLRRISTFSMRPASISQTLKTNKLHLFYSVGWKWEVNVVFASLVNQYGWYFVFEAWVDIDSLWKKNHLFSCFMSWKKIFMYQEKAWIKFCIFASAISILPPTLEGICLMQTRKPWCFFFFFLLVATLLSKKIQTSVI